MAKAVAWSSEVISIAIEMVLPMLLGIWLDRKLGTVMVFVLLGAVLGFSLGLFHLVRLTKPRHGSSAPDKSAKEASASQHSEEDTKP